MECVFQVKQLTKLKNKNDVSIKELDEKSTKEEKLRKELESSKRRLEQEINDLRSQVEDLTVQREDLATQLRSLFSSESQKFNPNSTKRYAKSLNCFYGPFYAS